MSTMLEVIGQSKMDQSLAALFNNVRYFSLLTIHIEIQIHNMPCALGCTLCSIVIYQWCI